MIGILLSGKEREELLYLLKKEMDEMLFDLHNEWLNPRIKKSMEERYQILFHLFKKIAPPSDCLFYMRKAETKE